LGEEPQAAGGFCFIAGGRVRLREFHVSQVEGEDVKGALRAWAAALEVTEIAEFDDRRKAELIGEIETQLWNDMRPVLLRGLANVWCTSASVSGGSMLINIIATAA
jgi:hypothetical protein